MSETIEQFWNFDDADLGANRLGQLTEKQKSYLVGKPNEFVSYPFKFLSAEQVK